MRELSEDADEVSISVKIRVLDSDDVFLEVIDPLRRNKELSAFIYTLLKLYHDNDTLREIVDTYNEANNPMYQIMNQLERISNDHNKAVAAVNNAKQTMDEAMQALTGSNSEFRALIEAMVHTELQKMLPQMQSGIVAKEVVSSVSESAATPSGENVGKFTEAAVPKVEAQNSGELKAVVPSPVHETPALSLETSPETSDGDRAPIMSQQVDTEKPEEPHLIVSSSEMESESPVGVEDSSDDLPNPFSKFKKSLHK